jgi:Flp pilus assembly protein TadG
MTVRQTLKRLLRSNRASAVIEFAILAPVIFSLMLGVLQLGLHMHSYNAIRSVTTDTARFAIVEFQKNNNPTNEQIQQKAIALAANAPYMLDTDNLSVTISQPNTDIAGTTKLMIQMTYIPDSVLSVIGVGSPTLTITRPVYVS